MNSAPLPNPPPLPTDLPHWEDVRRLQRRLCVLRAMGQASEAARLENSDFARALAIARSAGDDGIDETALLAEESERVASASVLAELMAPLLAERLRAHSLAHPTVATVAPQLVSLPSPVKTPAGPPTPPPSRPRETVTTSPSITDLLDGMLAQQAALAPARAPL